MTNNLIKQICASHEDAFYIDLIKHELEWQLYDYGDHEKKGSRRGAILRKSDIITYIKAILQVVKQKEILNNKKKVLSFVPFSIDAYINVVGFRACSLPFTPRISSYVIKDIRLLEYKLKIDRLLRAKDFNYIINPFGGLKLIKEFYAYLYSVIKDYQFHSCLVMTDEPFIERCTLAICKELKVPTFIFSHGLPGTYDLDLDNRSDYLMVFGDKIKKNYVDNGFDGRKIHVVGNTKYHDFSVKKTKWDDSKILVVPESSIVWQQHSYGEPFFPDRNRILVYLYEVETVLKSRGYSHAYFRPHPSFNREWFMKYIDLDFYTIDKTNMSDSINNYKLVIGATSTVFLEYSINGVNYIVYERRKDSIYPPFDGSDARVAFANTPEKLCTLLDDKRCTDSRVALDYIQPFNVELFQKLVLGER